MAGLPEHEKHGGRKMKVVNPDIGKIYHLWHVCKICLHRYTHSQGDFETIKRRECCSNNFVTLPIFLDFYEMEAEK